MNIRKFKDSKTAIYICAFLIPFLMMIVFWALCGVYPFGKSSILTGDMDLEFVDFYAYFINTLKTNNDWSYMLTKTLGGDFPGLAAFQLHDPLLFLLLLSPGEKIAVGIELVFTLQISIAGLSASVLLNNRYRRSWLSLLFSTGYAFCAFFFGYLVLTIYFGALAILPLVVYFFLQYLDGKASFIPFTVMAVLYIFINYHMGFMLVIFLVILYVSRVIADPACFKKLPGLILTGATVLLIDGFFLLRTGLSLLGEKTTQGADYGFYRRFPLNQLLTGLFCGTARNDLRPLIYCGVCALFFAVLYFLSAADKIRVKLANAFVLASLALSMWINTFDAVWHGFNNPEGFYWRYAYYISLTVLVLAYKGFLSIAGDGEAQGDREVQTGQAQVAKEQAAKDQPAKKIFLTAAILVVYMILQRLLQNPYLDLTRFVINAALVTLTALAAFLICKNQKLKNIVFAALLLITFSELLYSAKTSYLCLNTDNGELPEMAQFTQDYHDIDDVISSIKKADGGFYRIEKDFDRAVNDPSLFDYIGLSHDSSCEKDEILDWLVNFGFCKTVYFTYYNGGSTAFVDDLFGVRYYVSRFDSVEKPYEAMPYEGKYHPYHNPDALPMAYIAPPTLAGEDLAEGNTFEKQNRIASHWIDRPVFLKADADVTLEGAEEQGSGHYVRTDEEGYIVYNIPVKYRMPVYFYFYAPERQNGEVFVNGESRDVYFTVNHWNTLCAGTYAPGDELEIRMKIADEELTISEACFYYEDPEALSAFGKAAKDLDRQITEIVKIKSSHLAFETNSDEARNVVVSIPYEDSWRVTCDGVKINASKCMGMLLTFDVPEGAHRIELKYTPEGTVPGLILSILGILLFAGRCLYLYRKHRTEINENKNA